jgi:hypothetical protein
VDRNERARVKVNLDLLVPIRSIDFRPYEKSATFFSANRNWILTSDTMPLGSVRDVIVFAEARVVLLSAVGVLHQATWTRSSDRVRLAVRSRLAWDRRVGPNYETFALLVHARGGCLVVHVVGTVVICEAVQIDHPFT